MSCFIVPDAHIHALVGAACIERMTFRGYLDGRRYHGTRFEVNVQTASELGAMLVAANHLSFNANYAGSQNVPRAVTPAYRFCGVHLLPSPINPVTILKAINCYEYQTCEFDEWDTSDAAAFCEALTATYIRKLPGYDSGPGWTLDDLDDLWARRSQVTP